jgi:hypothetical protein
VMAKRESILSGDVLPIFLELYFAENLNTVFCRNVSPGLRIVLGKSG